MHCYIVAIRLWTVPHPVSRAREKRAINVNVTYTSVGSLFRTGHGLIHNQGQRVPRNETMDRRSLADVIIVAHLFQTGKKMWRASSRILAHLPTYSSTRLQRKSLNGRYTAAHCPLLALPIRPIYPTVVVSATKGGRVDASFIVAVSIESGVDASAVSTKVDFHLNSSTVGRRRERERETPRIVPDYSDLSCREKKK